MMSIDGKSPFIASGKITFLVLNLYVVLTG